MPARQLRRVEQERQPWRVRSS